jgi:SP family general alpha glucoside:H+ symporter-like MFS transporter
MAAEISEKGPQHEQVEKGGVGYDNHGDGELNDKGLKEEARLGTENEHNLSLWQAVKTYKRAALWSVLISTTVVMEGYDVTLLSVYPLSGLAE